MNTSANVIMHYSDHQRSKSVTLIPSAGSQEISIISGAQLLCAFSERCHLLIGIYGHLRCSLGVLIIMGSA